MTPEKLKETDTVMRAQVNCAAKLLENLKEGEEPLCNIALYHLAVWAKYMLKIVCRRHSIIYTEDDSVDDMFNKTSGHLPAVILDISVDICYWHSSVQYEKANVKGKDEVYEAGRIIESFYNEHILPYLKEIVNTAEKSTRYAREMKKLEIF